MEILEQLWEWICDVTGGAARGFERAVTRVFGSSNARHLRRLQPKVEAINALEPRCRQMSDQQLREQTEQFRRRLAGGQSLDDLLVEAFAVCREAARRVLGMRHFDVQLLGGIVLHEGNIAEMATGEGKTLVATLPAYLNALTGRGVHIVTVNDYLARRDMEWMGRVYLTLGLTVGCIARQMPVAERQRAYQCDITYGTNTEFGFDYLRDNMRLAARGDDRYPKRQQQCQRGHHMAIVDEVDSILIDEARTPLIISRTMVEDVSRCEQADRIVRQLRPDEHFEVDEENRTVHLTDEGVQLAQRLAGVPSFYAPGHMHWPHLVDTALKAHHLYHRDVDYVVHRGKVVIVDQFTGRMLPGRRWRDGLHQAVEAKEGVEIKQEAQTLATITRQNYLKLYDRICGMTGTAMTEASEFWALYRMEVVSIPTNAPVRRTNYPDLIYRTEQEKLTAVADEIEQLSKWDVVQLDGQPEQRGTIVEERDEGVLFRPAGQRRAELLRREQISRLQHRGRPVLVGTVSIEKSERLSRMLAERGIAHQVLNAKHHQREAEIVAQAGRKGAVTIATNMAGRGTDIILGGNPETLAWSRLQDRYPTRLDVPLDEWNRLVAEIEQQEQMKAEGRQVAAMGGLHVIGTERHEARRIDLQLRGRCARQGDPGSTRFYLSLEDELLQVYDRSWLERHLPRLAAHASGPLHNRRVARRFEVVQKKVEERNFAIRQRLVEYDEVVSLQRDRVYAYRQQILDGADCTPLIIELIDRNIGRHLEQLLDLDYGAGAFASWASHLLHVPLDKSEFVGMDFAAADLRARDKAQRVIRSQVMGLVEQHLGESERVDHAQLEALAESIAARFPITLQLDRLADTDGDTVASQVIEQVEQAVEQIDLSEGRRLFEPDSGPQAAATWLQQQLGLEISIDELQSLEVGEVCQRAADHVRRHCQQLADRFGADLKQLERSLLLEVLDSAWKDQLWVMDQLRSSVRLRTYAHTDPVDQYKLEGMRLFDEMWNSIAQRVTELVMHLDQADADVVAGWSRRGRAASPLPDSDQTIEKE